MAETTVGTPIQVSGPGFNIKAGADEAPAIDIQQWLMVSATAAGAGALGAVLLGFIPGAPKVPVVHGVLAGALGMGVIYPVATLLRSS